MKCEEEINNLKAEIDVIKGIAHGLKNRIIRLEKEIGIGGE